MRVEIIGEEHEDIPSESDSQGCNGYKDRPESYVGLNGVSHSEHSFRGGKKDMQSYSGVFGGDASLPPQIHGSNF